jgi:membrane protein YdbS with pleckstrin-like domain
MATIKVGKEFKPNPALKSIYHIYTILVSLPIWFSIAALVLFAPESATVVIGLIMMPLFVILLFIAYWIPRYYESISYVIDKNGLVAKRGVWFKKTSIVPYKKITNIDIVQGPLSRAFGVSSLKVQTAGYSAASASAVEIKMEAIENPEEVRKAIDKFLK